MIVCHCHAITEADLIQALRNGEPLTVADECGGCREAVEEIMATETLASASDHLRLALDPSKMKPLRAGERERMQRWMHENVVAEMVNGLRWLSGGPWIDRDGVTH